MSQAPFLGFIPFVATDEFDITREILYRVLKTPFIANSEGVPLFKNTLQALLDFQAEAMFDCHLESEHWSKRQAEYIWIAICTYKTAKRPDLYTAALAELPEDIGNVSEASVDSMINLLYETADEISNKIQEAAAYYKHL